MTPPPRREPQATSTDGRALGDHLKDARRATHLTLRDVEAKTNRAVTNGYLSQIENNAIKLPSPNVLYHLAEIYGLDYSDLLERAGHRTPAPTQRAGGADERLLAGLPLRALEELNDDERRELTEYVAFMRQRRERRENDS